MIVSHLIWVIVDLPWEAPRAPYPECPSTEAYERSRLYGRTLQESYEYREQLHKVEAARLGYDWGRGSYYDAGYSQSLEQRVYDTTKDLRDLHKLVAQEIEGLDEVSIWRAECSAIDLENEEASFSTVAKPGVVFELATGERYLVGHGLVEWVFSDNAIVHRYAILPGIADIFTK
jgi:hypothetical protein